jgi:glutathionylspermidine synthase
MRKLKLSPRQ